MTGPNVASATVIRGLEGIYVSTTQLSYVNGEQGRLLYCGYNVQDLEAHGDYEETVYLLWNGTLPTRSQHEAFRTELAQYRALPSEVIQVLKLLPPDAVPMAALRTLISALSLCDPNAEVHTEEANQHKGLRLTAALASLVATFQRQRSGGDPVPPRSDLSHAANFLYMLTGQEPDPVTVQAMDSYLIVYADHGFNASTFAARVTASTLADMYSAVVSALSTLKGPLHGGAIAGAVRQFQEIGDPNNVDAWFEKAVAEKRRIMGIGHRVYKTHDPRALILRERARALAEQSRDAHLFEIAERLADRALTHPYFQERRLYPNVDYYGGLVLYYLGLPVDLSVPMFAVSRIAGWVAHVLEQYADNRLIRPRALYEGQRDMSYVSLDRRG